MSFLDRSLTPAERLLLPGALRRHFDLDDVRLFRRWHTPLAALMRVSIVRGAKIFWANAPLEATSLAERAHLAHELVHVWQYRALGRSGPELLASRVYRYRADERRLFTSYGYEQQAAIVEDFVRLNEGVAPRWAIGRAPIAVYEKIIRSAGAVVRRSSR